MDFELILTVIPKSSCNKLIQEGKGLKLKITAPPIDGLANKKIIELLSDLFSCPKTSIKLVTGIKSKHKKFIFHTLSSTQGQMILTQLLHNK